MSARQSLQKLSDNHAGTDDSAREAELEAIYETVGSKRSNLLLPPMSRSIPSPPGVGMRSGTVCFAQQKIGESIQALAKSLQLDVKNAEAHEILGRDLMIIGRFDAAQVEFEQGIRYDPQSAGMHYNLGKLFSMQDNWGPGRKEFEEALRIDPWLRRSSGRSRDGPGSVG